MKVQTHYGGMSHGEMLQVSWLFRLFADGDEDSALCIELLMSCAQDADLLAHLVERARSPVPAVPRQSVLLS